MTYEARYPVAGPGYPCFGVTGAAGVSVAVACCTGYCLVLQYGQTAQLILRARPQLPHSFLSFFMQ